MLDARVVTVGVDQEHLEPRCETSLLSRTARIAAVGRERAHADGTGAAPEIGKGRRPLCIAERTWFAKDDFLSRPVRDYRIRKTLRAKHAGDAPAVLSGNIDVTIGLL